MAIDDLLKQRIHEHGPITVAEFMDIALYDPAFGYYARASRRSGRAGDFFTSVDLGPLFGRLLAVQIAEMADRLMAGRLDSRPAGAFTLVDAGAGDGRLSGAVLHALADVAPHILPHTHLHLVERSAAAREAQRSTLAPWPDGATHGDELPATFEGVIVANELLDAMPVHQVVVTSSGLREVYVDLDADRLVTREGPVSSPAIPRYLSSARVELAPGARAEISLAAVDWVREAARRLARGFMILIDYGDEARSLYSEARASGTLGTYRGHRFAGAETGAPWLEHPGEQDITAHVDFSSVRAEAEAAGCVTLGLMDQTYFLMALARPYLDSFDDQERRSFKSLVFPGGLGSTMKVLLLARNIGTPALLGCSGPSRLT